MLAHYSNNHTGAVIEYQHNPKVIGVQAQVNYLPQIKHFCFKRVLSSLQFNGNYTNLEINDELIKPLCYKFQDWKYEKEYRLFNNGPQNTGNCDDYGLKIRRIYFGVRATPKDIDSVYKSN